jgi:hypothetical protein
MTETDTSRNIVDFKRRPINEWPKHVYLADFGDGEGTRPYAHIQRPDDTTPRYVRGDLYDALLARAEKAEAHRDELDALLNEGIATDADTRRQARNAALREAANVCTKEYDTAVKLNCVAKADGFIWCRTGILALIDTEEPK